MLATVLLLGAMMTPQASSGRLRIALRFDPPPPAAVEAAVVAEAARIWAPYGVTIAASCEAPVAPGLVVLRVLMADHPPAAIGAQALGSIEFDDGEPQAVVSLYAGLAWELLSQAAHDVSHWPDTYRDATLGRVLGRALAHETGHYLLRSRAHSATGLMQARQPITRFTDAWGGPFELSQIDRARLDELLR